MFAKVLLWFLSISFEILSLTSFKPEIYQEMILEIVPRKMECMFIYLQPNYRAEIRMESRTSDTVAAMMRR